MYSNNHDPAQSTEPTQQWVIDACSAFIAMCMGAVVGIFIHMAIALQFIRYVRANNIATMEQLPRPLQIFFETLHNIVALPDTVPAKLAQVYQDLLNFKCERRLKMADLPIHKEIVRLQLQDLLETTAGTPEELCDPISMELFTDPVFLVTGNTYNRAEIKEWFKRSRVEPMTQIHLTEKQTKILIPNHRMVEQVIDYLRKIAEQRAQAAHSGPLPVLAQEAEASNCMSTSNNARESRVNKIMRARQQRHAELFLAAFTQRQEQAQQIANEAQPDLEAGQQNANTAPLLTPRGTYQ